MNLQEALQRIEELEKKNEELRILLNNILDSYKRDAYSQIDAVIAFTRISLS